MTTNAGPGSTTSATPAAMMISAAATQATR
jgi:hypothetical protein